MPPNTEQQPKPRGRPSTSSGQRRQTRQKISDVAGQLFHENGYSNVSMRKIAKNMGISPMTLYGYFDAKIDILRTLWVDVLTELFEGLITQKHDPDNGAHLLNLSAAYVQYWLDNPDNYRLVFMAEGVMQPDVSLFLDNPDIMMRYGVFAEAIAHLDSTANAAEIKSKVDFLISVLHGIAHNAVTISGYAWSSPEVQLRYVITGISAAQ